LAVTPVTWFPSSFSLSPLNQKGKEKMSENIHKAGVITMPGDVHVKAALTNVSVAYMQDQNNFIADKVFPIVPVSKQSDLIWNFNPEQFNRDVMRPRAPATESAGIGMVQSLETYFANVWALHHDISDQTRGNADSVFSLDSQATELLTNSALIRKEVGFVQSYLTTGKWDHEVTGVAATPGAGQFLQWDNAASTPIEDIREQKRRVQARTGLKPNKLVLGKKTYDDLIDHPDIVDRVKYGQTPNGAAKVNMQALASLFEVDEVLVAEAVINSNTVGPLPGSDADTNFIFGTGALLVYTPRVASTMMPAAGLTFSWTGWMGASRQGFRIKKFRLEPLESDRIEIQAAWDQRLIGSSLGVFFNNAVAADA
jgi:hypothetical protein